MTSTHLLEKLGDVDCAVCWEWGSLAPQVPLLKGRSPSTNSAGINHPLGVSQETVSNLGKARVPLYVPQKHTVL